MSGAPVDESVFRRVFASSELGMRTPDREASREVAKRAGFSPFEFAFFDDTLENVHGARSAGMQAVHVQSSGDLRRALDAIGVS